MPTAVKMQNVDLCRARASASRSPLTSITAQQRPPQVMVSSSMASCRKRTSFSSLEWIPSISTLVRELSLRELSLVSSSTIGPLCCLLQQLDRCVVLFSSSHSNTNNSGGTTCVTSAESLLRSPFVAFAGVTGAAPTSSERTPGKQFSISV